MNLKEKAWTKEMEKPLYEEWKSSEKFRFVESGKPIFSIDTPPPYVQVPIHIGHATTYTLMDMFARFHRMIGDNVLFPLGLDRNGLPIEVATEKRFGVSIADVSREEFLDMCKKTLEEASTQSIDSFLKLGISFNSWKAGKEIGDVYLTDSKEYRTLTQSIFIELWNRGLIYEDDRINNYCPGCKTTLADAEIDYEDRSSIFNDVVFTVKETGEKIIIGTTRPELICTCAMVVYNPEDERYKNLKGKHAVTPVFNKTVPIKAHPLADKEKGTGLMMMCAFGDQTDIRFFREQNIEPKIAIGLGGIMNENAGFLNGLTAKQARLKMAEELKAKDLIVNQKRIMHRTPICERSKDEIEFIAMKEFYLKQVDFKEDMKKIADGINFYSPRSKQILLDWIESVTIDWPISRRRYYATEIPLWYCECGQVIVPPKGHYYQPWKESPPIKKCPNCSSTHFRGEERVLDTWFDSSNSPFHILQSETEFFKNNYPASLRPQGREIVRTWLYYTLLKGYLLTKKPIFKDAWIHYHVLDDKGKKMSKSLGNTIDPHIILEKYGAEPFRLWCAVEGNLDKDDMRCSFERIEGAGKTLAKLWNVSKFVAQFDWKILRKDNFDPDLIDINLEELDKWIIKEINDIAKYAHDRYMEYDFHNPSIKIRNFLWETFASHYIELVKNRAYNQSGRFSEAQQHSAIFTLHYCLSNLLRLLAPVVPFITCTIYKELYNRDVQAERFPRHTIISDVTLSTEDIVELNNAVWKAKKDGALSLKAEMTSLTLPEKFSLIEKDIEATHNPKKIAYGQHIEAKV